MPVEYEEALVSVTAASVVGTDAAGPSPTGDTGAALAFEAPMSGRFYGRPSPTDPPFVSPGDEVHRGQTVGLLEVMKTFNRLVYQGDGLPDRAIVGRVVPADGDDVVRGDAILALRAPTEE